MVFNRIIIPYASFANLGLWGLTPNPSAAKAVYSYPEVLLLARRPKAPPRYWLRLFASARPMFFDRAFTDT